MDEHVLAASVGLDKSIALRRVEPLHCTYCHGRLSPGIFERHKMVTEIRRNKGPIQPGTKKPPLGGVDASDTWQEDLPGRPEAIRRLANLGLKAKSRGQIHPLSGPPERSGLAIALWLRFDIANIIGEHGDASSKSSI